MGMFFLLFTKIAKNRKFAKIAILMRRFYLFAVVVLVLAACSGNGRSAADYPEWEYARIRKELKKGWNSWDTRSVFTQVYFPELTGVKLSMQDAGGNVNDQIRVGNRDEDAVLVHPYDHSYDGFYSEADASWHGTSVKLRCSAEGKRLVMLVTPLEEGNTGRMVIKPGQIWAGQRLEAEYDVAPEYFDLISMHDTDVIRGHVVGSDCRYTLTAEGISNGPEDDRGNNDGYYTCRADAPVLVYTGDDITVEEAETLLQGRKEEFERSERERWGDMYDIHHAMQTVLAWDTVYDPADAVVVTPVSRNWNVGWSNTSADLGGYVLFDWDTYFASEMLSVDNRELAICNAIEITMAVDRCGFVPNFTCSNDRVSYDRSQPPVGSRAVWKIYERYGDRWFLELLYPRLLRWNLWWLDNRQADGLLCWGSTPSNGEDYTDAQWGREVSVLECGLDNTYVYDNAGYFPDRHIVSYNDVGLSSMYVMDCEYLAKIAAELGRRGDARDLLARGRKMRDSIQSLWSEEDGMFFCKDLETGELVKRMDPTNFYPMLCNAATPVQARRMIDEHLLNEDEFWGEWVIPCTPRNAPEFADNTYWRGRIWGPTNFLVYLGLRNYDCAGVRAMLAGKSASLLMKDWTARGYIFENWNSVTGEGDDVENSDKFYHWGALLGYISLMENEKQ